MEKDNIKQELKFNQNDIDFFCKQARADEYQRGFIDGGHASGEQGREIRNCELKENYDEGFKDGWSGAEDSIKDLSSDAYKNGYNQCLKDEGKTGERWQHKYL